MCIRDRVVQGSKVLSPATLIALPRKGTSIDDILDGGIVVDLQRNLSLARPESLVGSVPEKLTSKREDRAPPPVKFDAKVES